LTKPDIIVLRDRPVILRCSVDGPADIQETLRVEDVEVAIELKAAPIPRSGDVVGAGIAAGLRCIALRAIVSTCQVFD
jgi:hypothetical protein